MGLNLCDRCVADCRHERNPNEIVIKCGAYKPPMTNADRLRAMSDEELAGYLAEISGGTVLKMAAQLGIPLDQEKNERYIDRLKEEYLKRLQQPAEEDT